MNTITTQELKTLNEILGIFTGALLTIAEVNGPMECSSQSDWRRRAVMIAKKTLDEANRKAKGALTGAKP